MADDIVTKLKIKGEDNSKRAFKSARGNIKQLSSVMKSALPVIAGLAGAGGFGALIKSAFEAGDNLGKTADRIGATTKGLAAIHLAAKLAGSSIEGTDKAMEKMVRSLGDISQNLSSTQVKVFEQLGLSIDEFAKMKADEQFERLSIAISGLPTQMAKASAASQLFGRSGTQMLNVMEGVSSNIAKAKEETEKFGTALTRVEVAKMEAANDAAARTSESLKGIANVIAVTLAPALESSFDGMTNFFVDVRTGIEKTIGFVDKLANELMRVNLISSDTDYVDAKKREIEWTAKLKQAESELVDARKNADTTMHIYGTETGDVALDAAHSRVERAKKMLADAVADVAEADAAIDAVLNRKKDATGAASVIGGAGEEEEAIPLPFHEQLLIDYPYEQRRLPKDLKPGGSLVTADGFDGGLTDPSQKTPEDYQREYEARQAFNEKITELAKEQKEKMEDIGDFAQSLGLIPDDTQTEFEKLQAFYDELAEIRAARVEEINANIYLTEKQKQDQLTAITKEGEEARADLEKKMAKLKERTAINSFKTVLGALSEHSRAAFNINKGVGIVQATINTYEAITKALSAYPPPFNFGMAAAVAAKGFAQVAAIKSQSFRGGGGSGAAGGGAPGGMPHSKAQSDERVAPGSFGRAEGSERAPIVVNVRGGIHDDNAIIKLVEKINDLGEDGIHINARVV